MEESFLAATGASPTGELPLSPNAIREGFRENSGANNSYSHSYSAAIREYWPGIIPGRARTLSSSVEYLMSDDERRK